MTGSLNRAEILRYRDQGYLCPLDVLGAVPLFGREACLLQQGRQDSLPGEADPRGRGIAPTRHIQHRRRRIDAAESTPPTSRPPARLAASSPVPQPRSSTEPAWSAVFTQKSKSAAQPFCRS